MDIEDQVIERWGKPTHLSPLSASKVGDWPDPQPLPIALPAVTAFDIALLPQTLQPWAADIIERVQCSADYVGAAIMCSLGALVGRKVAARPQAHTDWTEVCNQWACLIGRPGTLKSPAIEQALTPLKRLAANAVPKYQEDLTVYMEKARVARLRAEASEKAARGTLAKDKNADIELVTDHPAECEPTLKRYITSDSTPAALGELLRQNPNGVLVHRDELVSLLKALDRDDNAEGRGFYLTGWNGTSSYTFDRIARGMHLHVDAVCLSILGSTQPGRIAEYIRHAVKGGAGDDGLIQRFGLTVWPDTSTEWQDADRWPDSAARQVAWEVYQRLDALDPIAVGASSDEFSTTPYLRFANDAQDLFRDWRGKLETRLHGDELHPALEAHLAKHRKLVPSLALILHLADAGHGAIGRRPTLQACAWGEYLESHAKRLYASVSAPETAAAKAILSRLNRSDLQSPFAGRDIYRKGWAHLSGRDDVYSALQLLADLDWIRPATVETSGRSATVYHVNPKASQ